VSALTDAPDLAAESAGNTTPTGGTMTTTTRSPLRTVAYGAGAGAIASTAMAMYAMFAAWEKGTGFFTPLYHIASLWASEDTMMASMKDAMAGNDFHFVVGSGILGAMIHMMTGAMYGAVFGLLASRLDLTRVMLAGFGLGYGVIVFAMSAYLGLPLAAAVLGSGDPIENMAEMAGWGTFFVEHLVFGVALGALAAGRRVRAAALVAAHAH
jgi:hypothetical protein